jgi:hypothetical protein
MGVGVGVGVGVDVVVVVVVVVVEGVEGVDLTVLFWECLRRDMNEATSSLGKRVVSCCCCFVVFSSILDTRESKSNGSLFLLRFICECLFVKRKIE